jgi:hypothetical protein
MPALRAEETLREKRGQLGAQALYDLTLAATGDKAKATAAQVEYMEVEMREGRSPQL